MGKRIVAFGTGKMRGETREERLERMFRSEKCMERGCAAWEGYKLNILIDDPHPYVRTCVADMKFGLDKLASDPNMCVVAQVQRILKLCNLTLEEWATKYPERCVLPENRTGLPHVCPKCDMKFRLVGAKYCPYCATELKKEK